MLPLPEDVTHYNRSQSFHQYHDHYLFIVIFVSFLQTMVVIPRPVLEEVMAL